MRFRDTIQISNRVSVYFDDKLVYRTKNALVHGQKMTGRCLTSLNSMMSAMTDNEPYIGYQSIQWADTYGCIPTAIHIANSAGSSNWWMPIMSFSESYTGSSPNEIATVKYIARADTDECNFAFRYLRLGALNNWTRALVTPSTGIIIYGQGGAPGCNLLSTEFCGQPSILTFYNTLTGYIDILKQETGFISSVTNTMGYRIYDNGTNWCVEGGSGLAAKGTMDSLILNCSKYGADTLRTDGTTNLVQFSSVDLTGNNLTKSSGTSMSVVWEIIYS